MAAENRLTAEQLATLEAGDTVTTESAQDFRRPRQATGTVVRVAGPHIFVKVRSPHGATFQECYGRRDGIRVGGVSRAELVNPGTSEPLQGEARRRVQRVDSLYREWTRNRTDVERLRRLQAAISECLKASASRDETSPEDAQTVGSSPSMG